MLFQPRLMPLFALAAGLLISVFLLAGWALQQSNQLRQELSAWYNSSLELERQTSALEQLADHYKRNAPRDYDSYNRDVRVFYQQFLQALQTLDNATAVQHQLQPTFAATLPGWPTATSLAAQQTANHWQHQWQQFQQGFTQALGNPKEPRLEWAAEHVLKNSAELGVLNQQLQNAIKDAEMELTQRQAQGQQWVMIALIALVLMLLALLSWRVVRPMVRTARACEQVALGHYGLQIKEDGSAETRQLQQAFNQLSARSKLMLDLVKNIHQPADTHSKLAQLFDSGRSALGINWLGLVNIEANSIKLSHSAPAALDMDWHHRHISPHKALGQELLSSFDKQWLSLSDIRQLAISRHDERFLRELHKNTLATQVVGYPFRCPQHKQFILLFSTRQKTGFDQQQTELIRTLVPLMADALLDSFQQSSDEFSFVADAVISIP